MGPRQLARLREQVPRWVQQAGLVLSVFFVCFGFSQFALVVWGLRPLMAVDICQRRSQNPGSGRR